MNNLQIQLIQVMKKGNVERAEKALAITKAAVAEIEAALAQVKE